MLRHLSGISNIFLAGEKLQQDIIKWLSPPDPWKNHHISRVSRHSKSAAWFIQGSTFSEWKASEVQSSSLWIHGKRPLIPTCYAFRKLKIPSSQRAQEKVFFGKSKF